MATTIICTDGSELATRAAVAGASILRPTEHVVVATVIDAPDESLIVGDGGFAGPTMSPQQFDELNRRAEAEGRDVVATLARKLNVAGTETMVMTGSAATALCALAEERSASAIVVGSRGRGGIKRAVLGSVSDHVVRNAPCPVLVVGSND